MAEINPLNQNTFNPIGWGEEPLDESGESGESGGSQTGEVEFRLKDAYSLGPNDDVAVRSPEQIRHLEKVHKSQHEYIVNEQKKLIEERAALKQGKKTVAYQNRQILGGGAGGGASQFKEHKISAIYDGIRDEKTRPDAAGYEAETNQKKTDELRNELSNRPRFTPQFRPSGL